MPPSLRRSQVTATTQPKRGWDYTTMLRWLLIGAVFLGLAESRIFLACLRTLVPGHLSSHSALPNYALCTACSLVTLCVYNLWSRPFAVAQLLGLHGLPPCNHPSEGLGNNNNKCQCDKCDISFCSLPYFKDFRTKKYLSFARSLLFGFHSFSCIKKFKTYL